MPVVTIDEIRAAVAAGHITCGSSPIDDDVSSWDSNFQTEWDRAHRAVSAAFRSSTPRPDVQSETDKLLSAVFQFVIVASGSEILASYARDDFHLLIDSAVLAVEDPWLFKLWKTYRCGRSPYVPYVEAT